MEQFNFGPAKKQLSSFTGASGVTGGSSGLVPAPAAGDDGKCLMGNGTWGVVDALPAVTPSDNGKVLKVAFGDWSVENEQDISGLAPKASPVFTGSISLGRKENTTVGENSFAVGNNVTASASYDHAEGSGTVASGGSSHAEGVGTLASGLESHAEGQGGTYTENGVTKNYGAYGYADHVEGYMTLTAQGQPGNHAEGYMTKATGGAAHSEGTGTIASGNASHAEGNTTTGSGAFSHAEGQNSTASGSRSHAEGGNTLASGSYSHAEGSGTIASGDHSHAEGSGTTASALQSHAEGGGTTASGNYSHAEGVTTVAIGVAEHAGGQCNVPDTAPEWVASTSYAVGDKVSKAVTFTDASGITRTRTVIYKCKTANSDSNFTSSKWDESGQYLESIGNGTSTSARSNARTLDWSGNERLMGDIYVGCNADSTGGTKLQNATVMTGATGSTGGSAGLVPAPSATDNEKYLRGDGTWQTTPYPSTMTGATGSTGGSAGLVPSPAAGDEGKYLKGDGTWGAITSYNRQFWTSAQSASVSLAADGKTYLIWTAGSNAGTLGAMMDTTNGAVVIVSNGEYAVLHKGSGITVSVANDELTVAASTGIKMAIVEL